MSGIHLLTRVSVVVALALSGVIDTARSASSAPVANLVTSPNPADSTVSDLFGVTCVTAIDCIAVGFFSVNGQTNTLVEHWDGTGWSIVSSPNAAGMPESRLRAVTCTSNTDCVAVGSSQTPEDANGMVSINTLVEHWDGNTWSIVPSPNVTTKPGSFLFNTLRGVSCSSSADCFAVGDTNNGVGYNTLVEHWNGTSWKIVASPNRHGDIGGAETLSSVSCTASTSCSARSATQPSGSRSRPLG